MSKIEKYVDWIYLAGIVLWVVLAIVYDGYPGIDGWQAAIVFGSLIFVVMWPYWRSWPFWWFVGIGIYVLVVVIITNSMDAVAQETARWPSFIIGGGGWLAMMWPIFTKRYKPKPGERRSKRRSTGAISPRPERRRSYGARG